MKSIALMNGKIYVERGVFAQALYAEDGIIRAVDSNETVRALCGRDTQIIDCEGKTVIPGLNDSHLHLLMVGEGMAQADITGVTSIDEMVERCREFLNAHPQDCLHGLHSVGWNQDFFTDEKRIPNRHDLDRISTEIPVVLERVCGHIVSGNTKAIEMMGLTKDSPPIPGGTWEKEEDGTPSGIFTEHACGRLLSIFPPATEEEYARMFCNAGHYAVSRGVTSVQSNDCGTSSAPDEILFPMLRRLYREAGETLPRYRHQVCFSSPERFQAYLNGEFRNPEYIGNDRLSLGPLKLFKDGSLGGRTGTMRGGYLDDPGNYGVETTDDATMDLFCHLAAENGVQVVTHVIGDKAIEDTVGNYERVLQDGKNPLRHGLVHCQITDLPLLERIAKDGIGILYQPIFLDYDMHAVLSRCGEQLSSTSYAFRTAEALGAPVSYGTDSPVEDCNPFANLYAAVTRKDHNGWPEKGFFPAECVDVYQALDAYTVGSAWNEFREHQKGRLKPGFFADFVILDRDYFTCDPMDIREITPVCTVIGGEIAYRLE